MHTQTNMDTPMLMTMRLTTTAAPSSGNPSCCAGKGGCAPPLLVKVLHRGHAYTAVGEWHAYWNASSGLTYTWGRDLEYRQLELLQRRTVHFSKLRPVLNQQVAGDGIPSNGSFDSREMAISLHYRMVHYIMRAIPSRTICYNWRQADETGLYDPGHGWLLWKQGMSVIKLDGRKRYESTLRHHPSRIDQVQRGRQFRLTVGSGVTYGVSASIFGIGIKAETNHSLMVAQACKPGSSRQRRHWVWGNNGNLAQNPQVEYSY